MLPVVLAFSTVSALCISFYENNEWERIAFAAFAQATCGHYERSLVVTNRPGVPATELSERRLEKIRDLFMESGTVDVFIFGHTNSASGWFRAQFDRELEGKLRLVYNSGCRDGETVDAENWLKTARAFVGHPEDNYGGRYTPAFTRAWFSGRTLTEAVDRANRRVDREKFRTDGNDPRGYVHGERELRFR